MFDKKKVKASEVTNALNKLDADGDGYYTVDDLTALLKNKGSTWDIKTKILLLMLTIMTVNDGFFLFEILEYFNVM